MKNSLHIIAAIVMVTLLAACAEKLPQQESDASSVPFRINVSIPETVLSKSPVSGAEGIFGIQLVCFDANSLFVGLGAATFAPSGGPGISGSIVGSVPANTTCIHFIANAGLIPDDGWKSMSETALIGSLFSDESNTHIVYWGFHKESNPESLAAWLNASPSNTVLLLRDRAKITLEKPDEGWNHSTEPSVTENIVSARFAVCNGRNKGMIAPLDKNQLEFGYNAPLTLPLDNHRYRGDASQLVSYTEEQFLFEDENTLENSVKVIMEITYMRGTAGNMSPLVKYHQVMLMDSDYSLYQVRRNHQYNIIVGNLPSSIAYDSFEEALNGSPSNNQTVVVKEVVPQVNSGGCSLTIQGGTSHIIQKDSSGGPLLAEIDFTYMKDGAPDPLMTESDFTAQWLSNKYLSYPNASISVTEIPGNPGSYRMSLPLYQPITNDLKAGKILLTDTRYGLSRFINIFSVTAFDFAATLDRADPSSPFVLGFTIPDNYPPDLFPFKVKIITEDLKPSAGQNAEKALGVEVYETSSRYGVPWNYCYTYEVFGAGRYSVSFTPVDPSNATPTIILDADYFGTLDMQGDMTLDYVRIN